MAAWSGRVCELGQVGLARALVSSLAGDAAGSRQARTGMPGRGSKAGSAALPRPGDWRTWRPGQRASARRTRRLRRARRATCSIDEVMGSCSGDRLCPVLGTAQRSVVRRCLRCLWPGLSSFSTVALSSLATPGTIRSPGRTNLQAGQAAGRWPLAYAGPDKQAGVRTPV